MKRNLLKASLAMMTAVAMMVIASGSMQGNSEGGTRSRNYVVYDHNNEELLTDAGYTLTLPERDNSISTYDVIPPDTRKEYENSGIVHFSFNGVHGATGFIVDDHTIATAAHCLRRQETGVYKQGLEISLYGDDGNVLKTLSKSNCIIQSHMPSQYTGSVDYSPYDYALIVVSEDLKDYEHFELGDVLEAADTTNAKVNVAGHVGDDLFIATGAFKEITDNRVFYDTDVDDGQSGSPVFVKTIYTVDTSIYYLTTVVAIHTRGISKSDISPYNNGVRMTSDVRAFYLNNPNATIEE
ncbi:MAG: trypsin-like peptidase domain-containing protein [Oscillospiraceae bacterium]|nr:trypsin-like peptidase domain-containing protein [Oscillospiraceae bacterium]